MSNRTLHAVLIAGLLLRLPACGEGDDDGAPANDPAGASNGGASGAATGDGAPGEGGDQDGGASGSDDGQAHRLELCKLICAKDPLGQGAGCGHEEFCVSHVCFPTASRCTPLQLDPLLECLAAVEDSKFVMCTDGYGVELDFAAYYYCYDAFLQWGLACTGP